jgi:quercetin dioxygenase-like cupin family protein
MQVISYREVEAKEVEEGSRTKIRLLNTECSSNFAVRHFEIEPDGSTPYHSHPWAHEIFMLEGKGEAIGDKETKSISPGDLISIPPNETHQIRNSGEKTLRLLCIIPR